MSYGIYSKNHLTSPSSVPKIALALCDDRLDVKNQAMSTLKKIDGGTKEAASILKKILLYEDHSNLRLCSLYGLSALTAEDKTLSEDLVPDLAKTVFADSAVNVRIIALNVLQKIAVENDKKRNEILITIKRTINDDDENVSLTALNILTEFEPGTKVSLPVFKRLLGSNDEAIRIKALLALKSWNYPKQLFSDFISHMADHDPSDKVRTEALIMLRPDEGQNITEEIPPAIVSQYAVKQGEKGFLKIMWRFPRGNVPVALVVKKIIDGYPMVIDWKPDTPFSEEPGFHQYIIGEKKIIIETKKNMITPVTVNIIQTAEYSRESGRSEVKTYFYTESIDIGKFIKSDK